MNSNGNRNVDPHGWSTASGTGLTVELPEMANAPKSLQLQPAPANDAASDAAEATFAAPTTRQLAAGSLPSARSRRRNVPRRGRWCVVNGMAPPPLPCCYFCWPPLHTSSFVVCFIFRFPDNALIPSTASFSSFSSSLYSDPH